MYSSVKHVFVEMVELPTFSSLDIRRHTESEPAYQRACDMLPAFKRIVKTIEPTFDGIRVNLLDIHSHENICVVVSGNSMSCSCNSRPKFFCEHNALIALALFSQR